eukprot:scaffold330_cov246-Pinguiococcus_pyrenoidosus.AAC.24
MDDGAASVEQRGGMRDADEDWQLSAAYSPPPSNGNDFDTAIGEAPDSFDYGGIAPTPSREALAEAQEEKSEKERQAGVPDRFPDQSPALPLQGHESLKLTPTGLPSPPRPSDVGIEALVRNPDRLRSFLTRPLGSREGEREMLPGRQARTFKESHDDS